MTLVKLINDIISITIMTMHENKLFKNAVYLENLLDTFWNEYSKDTSNMPKVLKHLRENDVDIINHFIDAINVNNHSNN